MKRHQENNQEQDSPSRDIKTQVSLRVALQVKNQPDTGDTSREATHTSFLSAWALLRLQAGAVP
jgi:hypothetical protein